MIGADFMLRRYFFIIVSTFIITLLIVSVGILQIMNNGIEKYHISAVDNQKQVVNTYFENQVYNMAILARAHAVWTDAIDNVNTNDELWIQDNLTNYLYEGEFNVDFVFLSSEDMSSIHMIGVQEDQINQSNIVQRIILDDVEESSFIILNGHFYLVTGLPFSNDDGSNQQGVFVIGTEIDSEMVSDLVILSGENLVNSHLFISNLSTYTNEEVHGELVQIELDSIDDNIYIYAHYNFSFIDYIDNTIKGHTITIVASSIFALIVVVVLSLRSFQNQFKLLLNQLEVLEYKSKHYKEIQKGKSSELNTIIDVLNDIGVQYNENLNMLLDKNLEIISLLATANEINDPYTAKHSENVTFLSSKIAFELGIKDTSKIEFAARVHDIGKVFIQHSILNKKDYLTVEEFSQVKNHPIHGARLLENITKFDEIILAVKHHHEKFDGTGYPDKLSGEDIPLYARIIAVADVYDALTTKRPYRDELTNNNALEIMIKLRGKHFDPVIFDVFLKIILEDQNQIDGKAE